MNSTSISLLRRLRHECHDNPAWERFVELYAPLIFCWCRNYGLNDTDASDLVQEVMTVMVAQLPHFEYAPDKRFRGWLHTITANKARDFHRRNAVRREFNSEFSGEALARVCEDEVFDEAQYRTYLVQRMRQLIQAEFQPMTWRACWMSVTEGRSAADIGRELGISANAVRVAKWRVLRRLRSELEGLMD